MRMTSAADRRAALSRAGLPAQWRPLMKQWSSYRRASWNIDRWWTAYTLTAHVEILKGNGAWGSPLRAPQEIVWIDESVANLAGCIVAHQASSQSNRRVTQWAPTSFDACTDDDYWSDPYLDEDRKWEERYEAARKREADVLLMHYLLPHVRLYRKLRALELSERGYYYRLNSALSSLSERLSPSEWIARRCAVLSY